MEYKTIFTIELWHDYLIGQPKSDQWPQRNLDVSQIIGLEPTTSCQEVLSQLHWLFRTEPFGARLIAAATRTDAGQWAPFVAIEPCQLTFRLVIRDANFFNYTNLPLGSKQDQTYYFSNKLKSGFNDRLFITHPLSFHKDKETYEVGQLLITKDKSHTYEANWKTNQDLTSSAWLEPCPGSQYVSNSDRKPLQDTYKKDYTPNTLALVEIFLKSDEVEQDFKVLEVDDEKTFIPPEPCSYIVRFKNRSTFWRYHYPQKIDFNVENYNKFTKQDPSTLISKEPIGLRMDPGRVPKIDRKQRPIPPEVNERRLPMPDARYVSLSEIEKQGDKHHVFLSDIYL